MLIRSTSLLIGGYGKLSQYTCVQLGQSQKPLQKTLEGMVGLCVKRLPLTKETLVRYPARVICEVCVGSPL